MANEIGTIKSINGNSMALNGQTGQGANKPMASGNGDPGGTKPSKTPEAPVAMPK